MPPGYYVRAPGQIAPCPKGEFKLGFIAVGTCSKCAAGVSTPEVGSTTGDACTLLLPSFVSVTKNGAVITETKKCPQNSYCPGTTSTSGTEQTACATGLMTQGPGAQSASECSKYTPHFLSGNGRLLRCVACTSAQQSIVSIAPLPVPYCSYIAIT